MAVDFGQNRVVVHTEDVLSYYPFAAFLRRILQRERTGSSYGNVPTYDIITRYMIAVIRNTASVFDKDTTAAVADFIVQNANITDRHEIITIMF